MYQGKLIAGEEETLGSCGNDCIYKKGREGDNWQQFCFPTSYSQLENQCDSNNISPLLGK